MCNWSRRLCRCGKPEHGGLPDFVVNSVHAESVIPGSLFPLPHQKSLESKITYAPKLNCCDNPLHVNVTYT